jgi:hypothetical protein
LCVYVNMKPSLGIAAGHGVYLAQQQEGGVDKVNPMMRRR